ncbi:MAG: type III secretion system export apparatus subunit SctT [Pseudomonadota bacterium]
MTGIEDLVETLVVASLSLARMLGCFAMIPVFQASVLPSGTRMAIAMSLILVLLPSVAPDGMPEDLSALTLVAIGAKEVVIGVLIGFAAATIFHAAGAAGFFIDNQRGSAMASSVDPLTGAQISPIGIFLVQFLAAYFMLSGGFLVLLSAIYQSYQLLPVLSFYPDLDLDDARHFLGIVDAMVALAIVIAAPAMIAMFFAEFGLGLVSRFAPQLNVFFLAMPVKSAVGILLLILYLHTLPEVFDREIVEIAAGTGVLAGLLR